MTTHRRLNKTGKITIAITVALLVFLPICFLLTRKYIEKEAHILKMTDKYQIKIDYPIMHYQKLDSKIKNYVKAQKNAFLKTVELKTITEENQKFDLVIGYQLSKRNDLNDKEEHYHVHLETYSYIGQNQYIRDDETFHYNKKTKKFLTIKDYLTDEQALEKLSVISYYYVMQYREEQEIMLDEAIVSKATYASVDNYQHFTFKENGVEFLFPLYEFSSECDTVIKIMIPAKEINELLKEPYQIKATSESKQVITPEKRDLTKYKDKKLIAFTFDDGPSDNTTKRLLDVLKQHDAKVTFFVLGNRVEQNQNVLKRAYQEGHAIGNHSYNHRNLLLLDNYARIQEIKETNEAIENVIGVKPTLLRPPYGNVNEEIKKLSKMYIIEWGIDTLDWKTKDKDAIANEIIANAHDGSIILLHDIYESSVDGALLAIETLEQEGYAFVTIPEMATLKNVELDYITLYRSFN